MIEFESVSYAFEDVPVLENVSLSIDDGEFVLLAGERQREDDAVAPLQRPPRA